MPPPMLLVTQTPVCHIQQEPDVSECPGIKPCSHTHFTACQLTCFLFPEEVTVFIETNLFCYPNTTALPVAFSKGNCFQVYSVYVTTFVFLILYTCVHRKFKRKNILESSISCDFELIQYLISCKFSWMLAVLVV